MHSAWRHGKKVQGGGDKCRVYSAGVRARGNRSSLGNGREEVSGTVKQETIPQGKTQMGYGQGDSGARGLEDALIRPKGTTRSWFGITIGQGEGWCDCGKDH